MKQQQPIQFGAPSRGKPSNERKRVVFSLEKTFFMGEGNEQTIYVRVGH